MARDRSAGPPADGAQGHRSRHRKVHSRCLAEPGSGAPCPQSLAPEPRGCLQRGAWSQGNRPNPGELFQLCSSKFLQLWGCAQRGGRDSGGTHLLRASLLPTLTS